MENRAAPASSSGPGNGANVDHLNRDSSSTTLSTGCGTPHRATSAPADCTADSSGSRVHNLQVLRADKDLSSATSAVDFKNGDQGGGEGPRSLLPHAASDRTTQIQPPGFRPSGAASSIEPHGRPRAKTHSPIVNDVSFYTVTATRAKDDYRGSNQKANAFSKKPAVESTASATAADSSRQHVTLLPHVHRPPTTTQQFLALLTSRRLESAKMSFLNPDMQFDDLGFAEGDSGAVFAGTDSKHTQLTVHVPGGHYNGFPPTPVTPGNAIAMQELQQLRVELKNSQAMNNITQGHIRGLQGAVINMTNSNHQMVQLVHTMNDRLTRVEMENAALRNQLLSGKHQGEPGTPAAFRLASFREQLEALDGDHAEHETTLIRRRSNPAFTWVPPERSSPIGRPRADSRLKVHVSKVTPQSRKRKIHNLTNTLPPVLTVIPAIPLTDQEIIVYFFNSLSRPIVSLRLYSRGWGPAKIVDCLNGHRRIEPPYLRNTCSVKCVTAQKRGVEKYGDDWDDDLRKAFKTADDAKATKMLEYDDDDEEEAAADIDLLDLCKGLKCHPVEHAEEGDVGEPSIFAKCVMYCEQEGQHCKLSEVHELAAQLSDEEIGMVLHAGPSTTRKKRDAHGWIVYKRKSPSDDEVVETLVSDEGQNGNDDLPADKTTPYISPKKRGAQEISSGTPDKDKSPISPKKRNVAETIEGNTEVETRDEDATGTPFSGVGTSFSTVNNSSFSEAIAGVIDLIEDEDATARLV